MFTKSAFFTAAVKNGLYSAAARKEEERLARAIPVRPEEREPFPDADFRRDDLTNRALLDRMVPPDHRRAETVPSAATCHRGSSRKPIAFAAARAAAVSSADPILR